MLKIKALTAISIFSIMFAGAWIINQAEVDDFYIIAPNNQPEQNVNDSVEIIDEEFKAGNDLEFGPREYVKIRRIS
ncbi:hypothetical protein ACUXCC_003335 [Cytobacillus horneckiae]|uniref:Uncharacterized protein n=1 Tax=Cytobacillus horneckiae TaxID=549687 RepID=A0A2N0ZE79_9BACI|nr:hypothetical protein [Cytobacillus horneckiae]MBN6889041.1 hypothetical protein [Cytobacillus horneckiae]MCM3180770.1 hypothetical protein [Cytobacillus horneckiae]MEC1157523.1 hypothetical protein [Cytobacillus horneckiae]MED2939471.1 hypothetical protein [Cytobacillus horneckiae]PKG27805.1 hypothetical protein CWS20_17075 [Cytobacillus horneckiae]